MYGFFLFCSKKEAIERDGNLIKMREQCIEYLWKKSAELCNSIAFNFSPLLLGI